MKINGYKSDAALKHVVGNNLTIAVPLLIGISWLGGSGMELIQLLFKYGFNYKKVFTEGWPHLVVVAITLLFLMGFRHFSKRKIYSRQFKTPTNEDKYKEERQLLIVALSPYTPRDILEPPKESALKSRKQGYSLQELQENLKDLNYETSVPDLRYTAFQCNWLPILKAIDHYPKLTDIVVLTTSGERGSFNQMNEFRAFVNQYFSSSKHITIRSYLDSELMKDKELRSKYAEGIPANDIQKFAEATLHVLDNIIDKYKDDEDVDDARHRVAIDVTSGLASMSAVLAAVSVSKGVFFHYTHTHSFESQELDITAE